MNEEKEERLTIMKPHSLKFLAELFAQRTIIMSLYLAEGPFGLFLYLNIEALADLMILLSRVLKIKGEKN